MTEEQKPSCGTCVHWNPPSERDDYKTTVRYEPDEAHDWLDVRARQEAEDVLFGACGGIDVGWDHQMSEPTPLAVAWDGSEYSATVMTRAEFYCALWELKTE